MTMSSLRSFAPIFATNGIFKAEGFKQLKVAIDSSNSCAVKSLTTAKPEYSVQILCTIVRYAVKSLRDEEQQNKEQSFFSQYF